MISFSNNVGKQNKNSIFDAIQMQKMKTKLGKSVY